MSRHSEEDRQAQTLALATALSALIAAAGTLAVTLSSSPTPEPPAPPPPVVITTPARPPTDQEVWRSCQAQATHSARPGTDATECMLDHQVGKFMNCLMDRHACPPTTRER